MDLDSIKETSSAMTNIPPTSSGSSTGIFSGSHATNSQAQSNSTFTIATPAVTQINENLSDASFMHPTHLYHQETSVGPQRINSVVSNSNETEHETIESIGDVIIESEESHSTSLDHSNSLGGPETKSIASKTTEDRSSGSIATNNSPKKKNKTSKKGLKLDTKSKLEKSRQSARECRARKKLRYQYLEDLVCNREKAVVKLREELTMFCQMSEQIDAGTISETDRRFLAEQTKENSLKA